MTVFVAKEIFELSLYGIIQLLNLAPMISFLEIVIIFFYIFFSIRDEMKWQKKLRQQTQLYWFSSHMSLWSDISFNFAVLINFLVAIFYPFDRGITGLYIFTFLW